MLNKMCLKNQKKDAFCDTLGCVYAERGEKSLKIFKKL